MNFSHRNVINSELFFIEKSITIRISKTSKINLCPKKLINDKPSQPRKLKNQQNFLIGKIINYELCLYKSNRR